MGAEVRMLNPPGACQSIRHREPDRVRGRARDVGLGRRGSLMPMAAIERVRASGQATGQRRMRISEASSSSQGAALATLEALISATLQLGADTVDGWSQQEARLAAKTPRVPLPLDDIQDAIASGLDPLGDAYCRIRGSSERRGLGQAYTPPEVISAMVGWA